VEAFSLIAVTVLSAIVGFVHLLSSARAFDAMGGASRRNICVKRAGLDHRIKAEDLVPGDIIVVNAGDWVPADARLIEAANLWAEESALTGKKSAVEKVIAPVAVDAVLGERPSMLHLGTEIQLGSGLAVVVATGLQTELGKIALGDA
jgi:Ca2+-transporting ATPase